MKTYSQKTFNHLSRWWSAFLNRLAVPDMEKGEGLFYWRNRVLQHLVAVGLIASFFILVPTVIFLLFSGYWHLAAIDTLIYVIITAVMMIPTLSYYTRTCIALVALYAVGVGIMMNLGVMSGGPTWLFAFAVIAGILLGFKAAVVAIVINAVTLALFGWLRSLDLVAVGQPFYPEVTRAFTTGFNFLFLNALVAFSIAGLTEGLQSVIIRANQARDDLVKEVDARKQTERFLQASEEKYRLLAENLSDILWSMDMDLNFTYMSPAAQTLLGWSADELKKLSLADTLTAESLDKALALINGMLAKAEKESDYSKAGTINLELRHKDGRLLQVEVRGAFLLGEDGRPIGILGITQDISGRIQARKEKEALQSRLAQSKKMEAVGLLASGVAHDLNNVLSGIVSYPDLLLLDLPADDAQTAGNHSSNG